MYNRQHEKRGKRTHSNKQHEEHFELVLPREEEEENHHFISSQWVLGYEISEQPSQSFFFLHFIRCYCWCHGNLNFTLIISDTRAYDFQNEIANSQKKKDCWRKISFRFESLHSLALATHSRTKTEQQRQKKAEKFQNNNSLCRTGNDNATKKIANAVTRQ